MTELSFKFEREMDHVANEAYMMFEDSSAAYAEGDVARSVELAERANNCMVALYHARRRGYWI